MKKVIKWIKVGAWAMLAAGLVAVNAVSGSAAQVNTEQQEMCIRDSIIILLRINVGEMLRPGL